MRVPYRSSSPQTIRAREQVGDRIRSLRLWRNLPQDRLALETGISRTIMGRIERGQTSCTYDALHDIARRLRVPVTWLVSDEWTWPADWPEEARSLPPGHP